MTSEQTFDGAENMLAVDILPARDVRWSAVARGLREAALLGLLYAAYSMVRLMADGSFASALGVAHQLLDWERPLGLDFEAGFNQIVAGSQWLSISFSFWYASAHFIVTGAVLVLLFTRRRDSYGWLRSTLVLATACALVMYLLVPTAPPRLAGAPYVDVLVQTADYGWWGAQVSVPGGWGEHTNELAALPSMHAGWSLWVAVVALAVPCRWIWKVAGVVYALITAVVVVGTANHWTLDILAGWAIVLLATLVCRRMAGRSAHTDAPRPHTRQAAEEVGATAATAATAPSVPAVSPVQIMDGSAVPARASVGPAGRRG